ncbi:hypothetical protein [Moraxella lacunata]|uniref:hypothetical protein n=1 Tax=Moraxella lacunata TaxID=477 RepID=UPI003EE2B91C
MVGIIGVFLLMVCLCALLNLKLFKVFAMLRYLWHFGNFKLKPNPLPPPAFINHQKSVTILERAKH